MSWWKIAVPCSRSVDRVKVCTSVADRSEAPGIPLWTHCVYTMTLYMLYTHYTYNTIYNTHNIHCILCITCWMVLSRHRVHTFWLHHTWTMLRAHTTFLYCMLWKWNLVWSLAFQMQLLSSFSQLSQNFGLSSLAVAFWPPEKWKHALKIVCFSSRISLITDRD